jgi:hypothetical protein
LFRSYQIREVVEARGLGKWRVGWGAGIQGIIKRKGGEEGKGSSFLLLWTGKQAKSIV